MAALLLRKEKDGAVISQDESSNFDTAQPALDPQSSEFSIPLWLDTVAAFRNSSLCSVANKRLSVCFADLVVHGSGTNNQYQRTFGNYLLVPFSALRIRASQNAQPKILRSIDGIVGEGEMLLVLGRPGSGCTTLLRTIAGDTLGLSVDDESALNYRGIPSHMVRSELQGECIYTAETDVHFHELSVNQTLEFAVNACSSPGFLPGTSHAKQVAHVLEFLLRAFNLRSVRDSKIGNEFNRGVSGGERRRVSLAEAFATWSPLQCWDNSTRGLDSATALSFVRLLRNYTSVFGAGVLMSVYQASESMYAQFDKVTVLYEGHQIFFGSCAEAEAYFHSIGFCRPENATTPDFLTSITHPAEAVRLVLPGWEECVPRTASEFRDAWEKSENFRKLQNEIKAYNAKFAIEGPHLDSFRSARRNEKLSIRPKSPYTTSFAYQVQICMKRNIHRIRNNLDVSISAIVGNIIMGFIIGSMFYNLDTTTNSFSKRSVLLFFSIVLNAFMSSFEVLSIWAQRPIVEKHSQYAYHHPCTEAIASIVGDLPAKTITSLGFNLAIYFLANLRRTPEAFFTFWIFAFVLQLAMSNFFRMVGSSSRTMAQTMTPVGIFISNWVMYTGFVLPQRQMHPWLGWVRWINPIFYTFESVMINEFHGSKYSCDQFIPAGPQYRDVAAGMRTCSAVGAVAGSDTVEGTTFIRLAYSFEPSHLWRNFAIVIIFLVAFLAIHLLTAEYIRPERSKGEVLRFLKREADSKSAKASYKKAGTTRGVHTEPAYNNEFVPSGIHSENSIVHWTSVNYTITTKADPKPLLTDVNGWVKPGTLTALMGVTGAGKTTLLDVIANRASLGTITGDIMVNGHARDASFQRKTGYVQQLDIHLPTATVRETLRFNALLRQPNDTGREEQMRYVEEVIKVLEMDGCADAVVGVAGESLNIEQRKRMSIAIELVARPEVLLFLDEPTSGLDSQTAWSICMLLRKLVSHGQAIMCTVHQPSAVLLELFDQLLLLEQPGRTIYFGPLGKNSEIMVDYFKRNGARAPESNENPADWVFDVTKRAADEESLWGPKWDQSQEKETLVCKLDQLRQQPKTRASGHRSVDDEYAAPTATQLWIVLLRTYRDAWRTPTYLWSIVAMCFGMAFFVGFSFWDSPQTVQGLTDKVFSIFLILTIFSNLQQLLIPKFIERRDMYEAVERRSKTYNWKVLVGANLLADLPWQLFLSLAIFLVWYYPTGLFTAGGEADESERGALMFLCVLVYMLFSSSFSALMAVAFNNAQTAVEITVLLYYLVLIFCGIIIKSTDLPRFWTFMYRVSPLTYLTSAMMSAGIANTPVHCAGFELVKIAKPADQTCENYLQEYATRSGAKVLNVSMKQCGICPLSNTDAFLQSIGSVYGERWQNFGIFLVYIAVNIGGTFALYWLARVTKRGTKIEKAGKGKTKKGAQIF